MIVSQCSHDVKVSASMCFLFGMLHLLTRTVRFGRDAADISGYACEAAQNTTTLFCSAVLGHSTVRAMWHFDLFYGGTAVTQTSTDCNNLKLGDLVKVITQLTVTIIQHNQNA